MIGAHLYQLDENGDRISIRFLSKALDAQRHARWTSASAFHREAMGCITVIKEVRDIAALCKHTLIVICDHAPLRCLLSSKKPIIADLCLLDAGDVDFVVQCRTSGQRADSQRCAVSLPDDFS